MGEGLLDYSLLLAVEECHGRVAISPSIARGIAQGAYEDHNSDSTDSRRTRSLERHRFRSSCGNYVYHIAIIDYLTKFNFSKQLESFYKVQVKNRKKEKVSCVEPDLYGQRFKKFINKEVIINEEYMLKTNDPISNNDTKSKLFSTLNEDFSHQYLNLSSSKSFDSSSFVKI